MRYLFSALFILVASSAAAQQHIPAGYMGNVAFDHDGVKTDGYRIRIDGVKLGSDIPPSALVNGTLTQALPSFVPGAHTIQACAFNAFGEACVELAIVADPPVLPTPPSNLRFTISGVLSGDGTITGVTLRLTPVQ